MNNKQLLIADIYHPLMVVARKIIPTSNVNFAAACLAAYTFLTSLIRVPAAALYVRTTKSE